MSAKYPSIHRDELQRLFLENAELSKQSASILSRSTPLQFGVGIGLLIAVGDIVFRNPEIGHMLNTIGLIAAVGCGFYLYADNSRSYAIFKKREVIQKELSHFGVELIGDEFRFCGEYLNPRLNDSYA
jgi:hypothetical protein